MLKYSYFFVLFFYFCSIFSNWSRCYTPILPLSKYGFISPVHFRWYVYFEFSSVLSECLLILYVLWQSFLHILGWRWSTEKEGIDLDLQMDGLIIENIISWQTENIKKLKWKYNISMFIFLGGLKRQSRLWHNLVAWHYGTIGGSKQDTGRLFASTRPLPSLLSI